MCRKKRKLFIAVQTCARWVKPAWPAERTFSIPTSLMGALRATPAEPVSFFIKTLLPKHNFFYSSLVNSCKYEERNVLCLIGTIDKAPELLRSFSEIIQFHLRSQNPPTTALVFPCTQCPRSCGFHLRSQNPPTTALVFPCTQCPRSCGSRICLHSHIRTYKLEDKSLVQQRHH